MTTPVEQDGKRKGDRITNKETQLIGSILHEEHDEDGKVHTELHPTDPALSRSTSAPPVIDDMGDVNNGAGDQSNISSRAYHEYYYSQRPLDPRLPRPLYNPGTDRWQGNSQQRRGVGMLTGQEGAGDQDHFNAQDEMMAGYAAARGGKSAPTAEANGDHVTIAPYNDDGRGNGTMFDFDISKQMQNMNLGRGNSPAAAVGPGPSPTAAGGAMRRAVSGSSSRGGVNVAPSPSAGFTQSAFAGAAGPTGVSPIMAVMGYGGGAKASPADALQRQASPPANGNGTALSIMRPPSNANVMNGQEQDIGTILSPNSSAAAMQQLDNQAVGVAGQEIEEGDPNMIDHAGNPTQNWEGVDPNMMAANGGMNSLNMAAMNFAGLGGMGLAGANVNMMQAFGRGGGAAGGGDRRNNRNPRGNRQGAFGNRGLGHQNGNGVWGSQSSQSPTNNMFESQEEQYGAAGNPLGMANGMGPAGNAAMMNNMANMGMMGNMGGLMNPMNLNMAAAAAMGMPVNMMGMPNNMANMMGINGMAMGNMAMMNGLANLNPAAAAAMLGNNMMGMMAMNPMMQMRNGGMGLGAMGLGLGGNLNAALSPANQIGMTKSKMRDLGKGGRRNAWLDDFRLNKGNSSFTLAHICERNLVVELASDQYGSRFIQQKLETATLEEKNQAFQQILDQTLSLCTDVFGNYVIQKFFEYGTPEHRKLLINKMLGNILALSMQMYGCRVVQKCIEVADVHQQQQIVRELNGHVMACVKDQNGNHVIQKCIEKVPPPLIQFIVESFVNQIYNLSTHPYGCRVVQRLLEHCTEDQRNSILSEILDNTHELCKNQYGNYVIQHVLIHGSPWHKGAVMQSLRGTILALSKHKFASNVIEKCFAHGNRTDRMALIEEVLGKEDDHNSPLIAMVKDQYANYVVQTMIDVSDDDQRELLVQRIRRHVPNLRKIPYGKHIIARIERLTGKPIVPPDQ